jgi:ribosomal protein S18 acetylase RimI-like enzyme
MKLLKEIDGICYGVLENEELVEMAHVIGEAFGHSDPLGAAVGMTAKEIESFVLVLGPKAVEEGLTVIAQEEPGRIVGAMFSDDLSTPLPDLSGLPASFAPIGALLERLDEGYTHTRSIVTGSHIHLNMLAVLSDKAGMGIAQNLVRIAVENAARYGYQFAIAEANGSSIAAYFSETWFPRTSYDCISRLLLRWEICFFYDRIDTWNHVNGGLCKLSRISISLPTVKASSFGGPRSV